MLFRKETSSIAPVHSALELLEELTDAGVEFALASRGSKTQVKFRPPPASHSRPLCRYLDGRGSPIWKTASRYLQSGRGPAAFSLCRSARPCGSRFSCARGKGAGIRCLGIADHARSDEFLEAGAQHVIRNFACTSLSHLRIIRA
jgi:hypothetical protein